MRLLQAREGLFLTELNGNSSKISISQPFIFDQTTVMILKNRTLISRVIDGIQILNLKTNHVFFYPGTYLAEGINYCISDRFLFMQQPAELKIDILDLNTREKIPKAITYHGNKMEVSLMYQSGRLLAINVWVVNVYNYANPGQNMGSSI